MPKVLKVCRTRPREPPRRRRPLEPQRSRYLECILTCHAALPGNALAFFKARQFARDNGAGGRIRKPTTYSSTTLPIAVTGGWPFISLNSQVRDSSRSTTSPATNVDITFHSRNCILCVFHLGYPFARLAHLPLAFLRPAQRPPDADDCGEAVQGLVRRRGALQMLPDA